VSRPIAVDRPDVPAGIRAIPVRTPIVRQGDDLASAVVDAVRGIAREGDVVAIAETAVAIAQGQSVSAELVRPSRLAYTLSRYADPMATVSQPESLQIVIDREGAPRVFYAAVMNVLGRFVGRRGLFYEILGEAIGAIDGYTGTMPPFERTIVFGPKDPDAFAQSFTELSGLACAIVDANDLDRAHVLGASRGVDRAAIERALRSNPHGNSDEQTPVVVLKWRGTGANPLFEAAR